MKQLILKKKGNRLPSGSTLLYLDPRFSSFLVCYVNAPLRGDKDYLYCSRDHVYMPSCLMSLFEREFVTRDFSSLVYKLQSPMPLSCDYTEVVVSRRYFDFSHYSVISACYDVRLPSGTFLIGVPQFLLFPDPSSLSLLEDCYLTYHSGDIYIVTPYDSSSVKDSNNNSFSSQSLFSDLPLPSIDSSLSESFSLREFLCSDHCRSSELYSFLTRSVFDNLSRLVECVLQPARNILNCPIYISSGFRTPALNLKIGGSPRSYHLLGRAADVYVPSSCSSNTLDLYNILLELPHVELINYGSFIHVAY